jgi:peptidoglycan/LPS O-acetylase OafA/YrhL
MKEIRALTGIRGIAALTVFLSHTHETLASRGLEISVTPLEQRLFLSGGRQVDIFFVLSGFILALIYATWFDEGVNLQSYSKFLRRRLARIYPLHAFMLILILSFVLAAKWTNVAVLNGLDRFTFSTLPQHFLLIHAWGFVGPYGGSWNPPSWSISIEALAYLLFPIFLRVTSTLRRQYSWILLGVSVAVGFAFNAVTHWGLAGFSGISRGLTEFALGCCVANIYMSPVANWLRTNTASLLAFLAFVICFALTPDTGFVIGVFTAPLLLSLSGENFLSRVFGCRPVYFLGEISYSIYLGHFLFSSLAYRLISVSWMRSGATNTALGLVCIVAFVLLLSTLTYYTVERPGRDLLSGRRKSPGAAALARADG